MVCQLIFAIGFVSVGDGIKTVGDKIGNVIAIEIIEHLLDGPRHVGLHLEGHRQGSKAGDHSVA